MDFALLHNARDYFGRTHERVRTLSANAQSRWSQLTLLSGVVGRRALMASLLVGGLCFATLAYESTARETLWNWKKHNLPEASIWRYALGSRGYKELPESAFFQKALKTLPAQMDRAGQVWTGKDSAWFAVFHAGGSLPVTLYCRRCVAQPKFWVPIEELGWEALGPALVQAERLAKLEAPLTSHFARDPRAIYY